MATATTGSEAIKKIGNSYDLVLIAAERAREISMERTIHTKAKHSPVITAIKEIEQGIVGREYLAKLK